MKIEKIIYNNGKNEGYFIKKRKGYVQIIIKQGESVKLTRIKKISEIRINEVTLKVEEVVGNGSYFG